MLPGVNVPQNQSHHAAYDHVEQIEDCSKNGKCGRCETLQRNIIDKLRVNCTQDHAAAEGYGHPQNNKRLFLLNTKSD